MIIFFFIPVAFSDKGYYNKYDMSFGLILIYSLIAGAATVAGIYLVVSKEEWSRKNSVFLISFSAGILLSVALGHLMKEAQTLTASALPWLLISFLFFYIIEHGLILHTCLENGECAVHPIDRIAIAGLGFHSLLDGVVIGVSFNISFSLGLVATLSVILHKLPDGISMSSILLHSGYERSKTLFYSWLVAIATPLGAIGSYFIVNDISENVLGILLAVAAGSFLYVAATDLIPEIHKKSQFLNIVLVLLGALFPFLVTFFLEK